MPTISLIGDSQAGGLETLGGLSRELAARGWQTMRWFNRNGASTAQLISDLPEILNAGIPDAVLVVAGGNDPSSAVATWAAMVSQLLARGVRHVYWVGPPAAREPGLLDTARQGVSDLQRELFRTIRGVTWIDGRTTAQGLPRRDEVHLTAGGYEQWAARLAPRIKPASNTGATTVLLAAGALGAAWWASQRMSDDTKSRLRTRARAGWRRLTS
jgi:lysophospholipase L1-like esterase